MNNLSIEAIVKLILTLLRLALLWCHTDGEGGGEDSVPSQTPKPLQNESNICIKSTITLFRKKIQSFEGAESENGINIRPFKTEHPILKIFQKGIQQK